MSIWYFADAGNVRQGPVAPAELVRLRLNGKLTWDTLVWRDGMEQWQPMRDFAAELAQADDRAQAPVAPAAPATPAAPAFSADPPASGPQMAAATIAPASPYAPPAATVSATPAVVRGGEVVYAGFWKRFAAMIIDGVVTGVLSWIVQIPLIVLAAGAGAAGGDLLATGGSMGLIALSYAVSLVIPLIYFAWMHASTSQASLGKMAVGIKVTRSDGSRLDFWRAFWRYVAYFLIALLSLGLGALVSAFTTGLGARKQALHDMVCDTLVVDKWAFTDQPDRQRRELGAVTWVVLVLGIGLVVLGLLGILAAIAIPAMAN